VRLIILRRTIQIATLILMIVIPVLNRKGITLLIGTLYSFAVGPVWITDPLSGFQVVISSLAADKTLLLSMAIPIVCALVFGRVFCSWMCPQNTISEIFDSLALGIMPKRLLEPAASPKIKYVILVLLLISAPLLGFPVANLISAPGIISVQVADFIYAGSVGMELGLIGAIVLSEFFLVRRLWCNFACPQGAFLGLFRIGRTMKVAYVEDEEHVCGQCLECAKACQLGLDPMGGKIYPLCHNCGDCIVACKRIKAGGKPLSFKF
jgi:ferredoxin-type protein NapH